MVDDGVMDDGVSRETFLDDDVLAALAEAGKKLDALDVPVANRLYYDTATETWWVSDVNGHWKEKKSNGNEK